MTETKPKRGGAGKGGRKGIGIRGRFVIYFTAFVLLMLCIIWVFQIGLLDYFYEKTKINMLDRAADDLAECAGTDEMKQTAYSLAVKNNICIRIYTAAQGALKNEYLSVEVLPTCLVHYLPEEKLNDYYLKAADGGGELIERVVLGRDIPDGEIPEERPEPRPGGRDEDGAEPTVMALAVDIVEIADGTRYVIFLNTEFTPMNSTVHTLSSQFVWLALALLICAVLVSSFFAVEISKPLIRMTESAKRLADGSCEPVFKEEGYRETRELAAALNVAAVEISRSDSLQRELIANVSHDLRTPLTMISGYAEIMRDIPGENTPENIQVIIDESKRLTDLVNDMFDLSKIQSGVKSPERRRLDVTATVREVMERYRVLVAHDGYRITFNTDTESAVIFADRTMMLQVIYNLINNAINYTGADKTVTVTQTVKDGSVRITVSDTGDGISPENLRNIWDRYYKVDKVHRRAAVGTGLGLSIVKNVLQLHGASFGVESTPGYGSSFWFELPLVPPDN